jgi:hypothetical protein
MATGIFFNGRTISVPGSYTEVDATGLEQIGLGAAGIVAVLATGEGGIPVSAITELSELIRFNQARNKSETHSNQVIFGKRQRCFLNQPKTQTSWQARKKLSQ